MCMAANGSIVEHSLTPLVIFLTVILSLLLVISASHDVGRQRPSNGRSDTSQAMDTKEVTRGWGEQLFNASEHEVPSGPNPISNR